MKDFSLAVVLHIFFFAFCLTIGVVCAVTLLTGCGGVVEDPVSRYNVADLGPRDLLEGTDDAFLDLPTGGLPHGYYQRGCYWDACEPPPQNRNIPLIDPIRDRNE